MNLYIIEKISTQQLFKVVEPESRLVLYLDKKTIKKLNKIGYINFINAGITDGKIRFNSKEDIRIVREPGCIEGSDIYILHQYIKQNKFLIVKCPNNYTTDFQIVNLETLEGLIQRGICANGRIGASNELLITSMIKIEGKEDINNIIDEQYRRYITKAKMMGLNIDFKYRIDEYTNNVILTKYLGNASVLKIPNFVNIIEENAFNGSKLDRLILGDNIRIIKSCGIDVTGTVELGKNFKLSGMLDSNINIQGAKELKFNNQYSIWVRR